MCNSTERCQNRRTVLHPVAVGFGPLKIAPAGTLVVVVDRGVTISKLSRADAEEKTGRRRAKDGLIGRVINARPRQDNSRDCRDLSLEPAGRPVAVDRGQRSYEPCLPIKSCHSTDGCLLPNMLVVQSRATLLTKWVRSHLSPNTPDDCRIGLLQGVHEIAAGA